MDKSWRKRQRMFLRIDGVYGPRNSTDDSMILHGETEWRQKRYDSTWGDRLADKNVMILHGGERMADKNVMILHGEKEWQTKTL